MDKRTNRHIVEFIKAVAKLNPELVKAYLFGSFAKGTNGDDSDIDVAIILCYQTHQLLLHLFCTYHLVTQNQNACE